jgi:hypothetical protein
MNRRIPNGTYGGVRGRGLVTPSYSIELCRDILGFIEFKRGVEGTESYSVSFC